MEFESIKEDRVRRKIKEIIAKIFPSLIKINPQTQEVQQIPGRKWRKPQQCNWWLNYWRLIKRKSRKK